MSGIGENRVFDKTSLEELKEQAVSLMECAKEVTEEMKSEAEALQQIAGEVPGEAKDESLTDAVSTLLETLDTEPYETMKTYLTQILDKLTAMVPAYDSAAGGVLSELSSTAASLLSMLQDLTAMIGAGSLSVSLEEFSGKLETYKAAWNQGLLSLSGQMGLTMAFMKGLVYTSRYSKDPVNLSTGNFYYEREDMQIRGSMPLVFKRYYNALDTRKGVMGYGWSHSLEISLELIREKKEEIQEEKVKGLVLLKEDGKEITFQREGEAFQDVHTKREKITETKEGYLYEKGTVSYLFDREGKLTGKQDEQGNCIRLFYDTEGRLCSAVKGHVTEQTSAQESPYGFTYTYDTEGYLKTVTDHTGRKISFFYVEGKLTEVTDPEGAVMTYRYDSEGRIRAIKNGRGIISVRNEYDEKGRVVRQRFPDKGEMTYTYPEGERRTILRERNGSTIIYEQDEKLRNVAVIYADGSERREYDEKDRMTRYEDKNGNATDYTYDENGNLKSQTNALGEKTDFSFDAKGKLLKIEKEGITIVDNSYNEQGQLLGSRDALQREQRLTYDEKGQVREIIKPDGSRIGMTYDKRGNVTEIKDPYGAVTGFTYDALNRVTETRDGNGNLLCYEYDNKDRIVCVTNPEGNSRRYRYNESGKVTEIEDFDGGKVTMEYNSINKPCIIRDKEGRESRRSYDLMWNLSEEILPTGAVNRYRYDAMNRLTAVETYKGEGEEAASCIYYTHDRAGNVTEICLGDGKECLGKTAFTYDKLGRLVEREDAGGAKTTYRYDAFGNLIQLTDAMGGVSSYTYDGAGQRISKKDPAGMVTTYIYDLLGNIESITDAGGRTITYHHEPGGRLAGVTYPDGKSVSYTYDGNGNVLTRESSEGMKLSYTYDCMNRIVEVSSSLGQKKCYEYDVLGNVTAMTDALSNRTTYEYTMSGKLSAVTDALSNRTVYAYDGADNLTCICQQGNEGEEDRVTIYERDPLGNLLTIKDALDVEEHYRYDALGRLMEKTDRDGYTTAYTYTGTGQTSRILYGDGKSVEMEYDALRRLTLVKDWLGETKIERDRMGRITSITDHEGRKVAYEWGDMGERKSMTYPHGKKVSYRYDGLLRLTDMEIHGENRQEEIHYLYDEAGRLKEKQFPGGIRTFWSYNEMGLPAELTHADEQGILDRYSYTYDLMGNKTGITRERRGLIEESGSYRYAYDALGRLTEVSKDAEALRNYRYDTFSNRIETQDYKRGIRSAFIYDAGNRMLAMEETLLGDRRGPAGNMEPLVRRNYSYDGRGNLIHEEEKGELLHGYEYGAMNRLTRAYNSTGEEAFYFYNGLGQRAGREVKGEKETYLLDLTRSYHNLLSIQGKDRKQTFYWDGNVTAMEDGSDGLQELHYYLQDELGSPLRVSGYATDTKEVDGYLTYGYDEFGNDLGRELEKAGIPSPYTRQGEGQPFGYTGYRYDNISNTYFAQAREYQPESGRFTAEDVIKGNGAAPVTLNQYGYCLNNALRYVDLNGKNPLIVILITIGASMALGGCGKKDVEPLTEPEWEPQPGKNPTPAPTPAPTAAPTVTIQSESQAYDILDLYIYGNSSEDIDAAINYIAQNNSIQNYSNEYDAFDDEIVAWTCYWNDRLNIDMDQDYVKAMIMNESTMGTNPNKNGDVDVMQSLYPEDMGMWLLAKREPAEYGYTVGYDPNEGVGKKYMIPKDGYPFLQCLFEDNKYNEKALTHRMSIAAGTRYLAYCYYLTGDYMDAIERYNGGGNPNYLQEIMCTYNKYSCVQE